MVLLDVWFLVFVMVLLPAAAVRGAMRARGSPASVPTGARRQGLTLLLQGLMLWMAVTVARADELRWRLLPPSPRRAAMWCALALGLSIFWFWLRERLPRANDAVLTAERLAPRSRGALTLWVIVACVAGGVEEFTYRFVGTSVLSWYVGGIVPAALICAVAFGFVHSSQGRRGVVVTFLFALVAQGLILITRSLAPAMIVHALHNIIAGVLMAITASRTAVESRSR